MSERHFLYPEPGLTSYTFVGVKIHIILFPFQNVDSVRTRQKIKMA